MPDDNHQFESNNIKRKDPGSIEPKLSLTSISDSQKNRNGPKLIVNASTYYSNLNNNNHSGILRSQPQMNDDSNDQSSHQQLLLQQQQKQLQTMQCSITNNEINYNTSQSDQIGQTKLIENHIKNIDEAPSRLSYVSRDVNDSYAYTNVQQYIEENELMPAEKSQSIRKWVGKVNSWCDDWEKKTIEPNIEDNSI